MTSAAERVEQLRRGRAAYYARNKQRLADERRRRALEISDDEIDRISAEWNCRMDAAKEKR